MLEDSEVKVTYIISRFFPPGDTGVELATHALQFTFNSCEGNFQYPFCFYPTSKLSGPILMDIYWKCIAALLCHDFYAYMGICDGGQSNRTLILLHFKSEQDAIEKKFTVENPYTGEPHTFMMDPSVSTSLLENAHICTKITRNCCSPWLKTRITDTCNSKWY